jgi:hypothetical protein
MRVPVICHIVDHGKGAVDARFAQVDCVQQKIAGYRREWARPPVAKLTGFATLCPPSEQLIRFHIMPQTTGLLVPGSLFLFSLGALADTTDPDREPLAILEVAGATSSLTPGGSSFGPSVAVEVTPIENWLEIEIGVTPLFRRHHSAEWNTDVLFKNPGPFPDTSSLWQASARSGCIRKNRAPKGTQ